MRRRFLPYLVVLLLLLSAACGGEAAEEGTPSPGETGSPTAGAATTTAGASSPSPTTPATPQATGDPVKLTSPEESSGHLFQAWKRGDRTAAGKFAEQDAVDTLFSRPYTGPDPEFMGCEHEVDHYFCRYRYEGGSMTFRVDGGVSAGYYVTEVTSRAD